MQCDMCRLTFENRSDNHISCYGNVEHGGRRNSIVVVVQTERWVCVRKKLKVVLAYWKVKTPCHAHGECIN